MADASHGYGTRIKLRLVRSYAIAGEGDRGCYPHRHSILSGADLHWDAQATLEGWKAALYMVISGVLDPRTCELDQ
jgi:hypothetical protein